jgi:hypothetical protein
MTLHAPNWLDLHFAQARGRRMLRVGSRSRESRDHGGSVRHRVRRAGGQSAGSHKTTSSIRCELLVQRCAAAKAPNHEMANDILSVLGSAVVCLDNVPVIMIIVQHNAALCGITGATWLSDEPLRRRPKGQGKAGVAGTARLSVTVSNAVKTKIKDLSVRRGESMSLIAGRSIERYIGQFDTQQQLEFALDVKGS